MNKTYDLIVIGAGLSSLMFLNQYIKKFSSQSILLLEQKKIIKQDQTFCVWEGPGLQNITKNFKLKPKRIWKKIVVKNAEEEVIKDISPYKYVCFDGKEVLEKLLKDCKDKVTVINNRKVNKIIYKNSVHEIKSVFVKQAFIGHEIEVEHNTWNKNEVHLMSFKKNKNEIEFTYLLPFSSKRALIETTVFSSSPNLKHIGRRHQEILKQYGPYRVQREEKAIIPMAIIRPDDLIGVLKIGTSAGMVRASSGYSMRRIANWVLKLNNNEISINNLSQYKYQPNPLLNWLDKIFLNVIYNFPEKGPYLFVKLFSKADISALIRFLSDDASKFDLINILLSMPKKIMLKGLFKK